MDTVQVPTQKRRQLLEITHFVAQVVKASGVQEGLCHVYLPHTTAALLINENADPAVGEDILAALAALEPKIAYRHAEGNADAHVLATWVGCAVSVPIAGGQLQLGRWQGIFLLELDGPRKREVYITCLRA